MLSSVRSVVKKIVEQKCSFMNKKIFYYLFLLSGELLIIICFLYFGRNAEAKLLTLNIIVSSIIYSLLFIGTLIPLVDFRDKSQKTIGSIGIRWFFTSLYMIGTIAVMIICNYGRQIDINSQIIIHGILFFLLFLGLFFSVSGSNKVQEVYNEERQILNRLEEMKKATKQVQIKLDSMNNIPPEIISKMTALQENLRYLSPCNNQDAYLLESNFLQEVDKVKNSLLDFPINHERIIENIQKCEIIYKERKHIFTN